jgi:carbon-monoxide dehydrogenase large subunit
MADPPYHPVARGRVRHVGEPVALIIAEAPEVAIAASEAIGVDYASLDAAADIPSAIRPGAPEIWAEAPGNICYDWGHGDLAATEAALRAAHHVTTLDVVINRVVPAFLEPRAAHGRYDPKTERFTLQIGCQSIHGIRDKLAQTLGVGPGQVRVISRDVGGAFGARSVLYPEYAAILWAARAFGRPIKWRASRGEEFLSSTQGRDCLLTGELGLDAEGQFLGLRVRGVSNMGARHTGSGPYSVMRNLARMLPGVYKIPGCRLELKGVFTNSVPLSSYRGVGRMEAIYLIERLIDRAAIDTGLDRVALRRRNLIPTDDLPMETPMGAVYDSGDYGANMDIAMAAADWDGFATRRAEAANRGRLRGIGLCNYIEGAGGGAGEYGAVTLGTDGQVTVAAGCVAQGQGHETTLAQIVAGRLGIDADGVSVTPSDTDLIADGVGTNASRSMVRAGTAVAQAADRLVERGRATAARLMQANPDTIDYSEGAYVADDGSTADLFEVARAMADEGVETMAEVNSEDDTVTYPNGCHICEVEIDPETGTVDINRFTATDDVGVAINPVIVQGQSQGGIVQGIGQALMEHNVHDAETGQPMAGSFLDYALPRAAGMPTLKPISNDHPSPTNPLGVKGAGEGGATGAPAAVISAILDALGPQGVEVLDMPATSERIWRAIKAASG